MTIPEITSLTGSIGIPGVILFYLIWRFDKFLTFLSSKLETYNKDLTAIAYSLKDVVEELKLLRQTGKR